MALSSITLLNTFDEWRVNHNQVIVHINNLTEGQHNTTGAIVITNAGLINDGASLNVTGGRIQSLNVKSNNIISQHLTITSNAHFQGVVNML